MKKIIDPIKKYIKFSGAKNKEKNPIIEITQNKHSKFSFEK